MSTCCLKLVVVLAALTCLTSCNRHDDLRDLKQVAERADQVYRQYKTADYPTAKAALVDWIRDLEGRLSTSSDPGAEMYKSDITTSYVRLAKLEEKNNGPDKEAYLRKAVAMCEQMKLKPSCAAEEVRKRVDGIDNIVTVK